MVLVQVVIGHLKTSTTTLIKSCSGSQIHRTSTYSRITPFQSAVAVSLDLPLVHTKLFETVDATVVWKSKIEAVSRWNRHKHSLVAKTTSHLSASLKRFWLYMKVPSEWRGSPERPGSDLLWCPITFHVQNFIVKPFRQKNNHPSLNDTSVAFEVFQIGLQGPINKEKLLSNSQNSFTGKISKIPMQKMRNFYLWRVSRPRLGDILKEKGF